MCSVLTNTGTFEINPQTTKVASGEASRRNKQELAVCFEYIFTAFLSATGSLLYMPEHEIGKNQPLLLNSFL